MKVFKENQEVKKSWALKLIEDSGTVSLIAVDSIIGHELACFTVFHNNGDVIHAEDIQHALSSQGYDPFEHGNEFNDDGSLITG